jgi:hypothetical protein
MLPPAAARRAELPGTGLPRVNPNPTPNPRRAPPDHGEHVEAPGGTGGLPGGVRALGLRNCLVRRRRRGRGRRRGRRHRRARGDGAAEHVGLGAQQAAARRERHLTPASGARARALVALGRAGGVVAARGGGRRRGRLRRRAGGGGVERCSASVSGGVLSAPGSQPRSHRCEVRGRAGAGGARPAGPQRAKSEPARGGGRQGAPGGARGAGSRPGCTATRPTRAAGRSGRRGARAGPGRPRPAPASRPAPPARPRRR